MRADEVDDAAGVPYAPTVEITGVVRRRVGVADHSEHVPGLAGDRAGLSRMWALGGISERKLAVAADGDHGPVGMRASARFSNSRRALR